MTDVIAANMSNISNTNNCSCKKISPVLKDVFIDQIETVEHTDAFENKLKDICDERTC